jgi:hypothetical protein
MQLRRFAACARQSRQVSFDIRQDDRHAFIRETLGKNLKCNGFTGSRCARNQTVPVGIFQREVLWIAICVPSATDEYFLCHARVSPQIAPGSKYNGNLYVPA